ncbi:MAG: hypothetical protein SFV32_10415 [Opitutaceae bacterium]|nr:hypothetical protein [Opitutaceae bacterium]
MTKEQVLDRIQKDKVIALIRADSSSSLAECAKVLAGNGLGSIELTFTGGPQELRLVVLNRCPGAGIPSGGGQKIRRGRY